MLNTPVLNLAYPGLASKPDEILLERQPVLSCFGLCQHNSTYRIVTHGQDCRTHLELTCQICRDFRQIMAVGESFFTVMMGFEVFVTQEEPGLFRVLLFQRVHIGPGFIRTSPAGSFVTYTCEGIE